MIYAFHDCRLDTARLELRRSGVIWPVEPQVFGVLRLLIERRDHVVTKDELIEAVWEGRIVSEAALNSRISAARRAIGDSGEAQSMIRTTQRRGFRFVAPVTIEPCAEDGAEPAEAAGWLGEPPPIRFCATPDGFSLAYALAGSGPPLVKAANWINHLENDWASPVWGELFRRLSASHELLRYDSRGGGLSDWSVGEIAFADFVADLETAITAAGLREFALLGVSQGAAVSIEYAVRHPDRVTHLILWGGFARGRRRRGVAEESAQADAFETLIRQGWGRSESTFRKLFATLYFPDATEEQIGWWTELQRVATTAENAVRMRRAIDGLDVSALLPQVQAPTLILHSQGDAVAPLSEARLMASRIPNARFVLLASANHLVLPQERDWPKAVGEILSFLDGG